MTPARGRPRPGLTEAGHSVARLNFTVSQGRLRAASADRRTRLGEKREPSSSGLEKATARTPKHGTEGHGIHDFRFEKTQTAGRDVSGSIASMARRKGEICRCRHPAMGKTTVALGVMGWAAFSERLARFARRLTRAAVELTGLASGPTCSASMLTDFSLALTGSAVAMTRFSSGLTRSASGVAGSASRRARLASGLAGFSWALSRVATDMACIESAASGGSVERARPGRWSWPPATTDFGWASFRPEAQQRFERVREVRCGETPQPAPGTGALPGGFTAAASARR